MEAKGRIESGENQSAPVRRFCKASAPQLPAGENIEGAVQAAYLIGADGKVSDVAVSGKASAAALKAVRRYIAGCLYKPAMRDGKPVAVRWRGELNFTTAPERR